MNANRRDRVWTGALAAVLFLGACQQTVAPAANTPSAGITAAATPMVRIDPSPLSPSLTPAATTAEPLSRVIAAENLNQVEVLMQLGKGTIQGEPVYSPDGGWLAVPVSTGLHLYGTGGSQQTLKSGWVYRTRFSPDGSMVAAGNPSGRVTIWETASGSLMRELLLPAENSYLSDLKFSPDGETLVVGYGDIVGVSLWRIEEGEALYTFPGMHAAYSPDGETILTASWAEDGSQNLIFQLHAMADGALLHQWTGSRAIYTPAGDIAVERDGMVRLMDTASGTAARSFSGRQVAYSADGKWMASSNGRVVELYDAGSSSLIHNLDGVYDSVEELRFSPDGTSLVGSVSRCETPNCVFPTRVTVLWRTSDASILAVVQDENYLPWFDFSPDSQSLITAGAFGMQTIDTQDGHQLTVTEGYSPEVYAMDISSDGRWVAAAQFEKVYLWDIQTGEQIRIFTSMSGCGSLPSVVISPNGQLLTLCGEMIQISDGEVLMWLAQRFDVSFAASQVAYSPDGKRAAVGFTSGELFLWDVENDRIEGKLDGEGGPVTDLVFSADGQTLVSVSSIPDFLVQIWRVSDGQRLVALEGSFVHQAALSPDGRTLATQSGRSADEAFGMPAGPVQLWDAGTGQLLAALDTEQAMSLAFSPDGSLLATGEADGSVRVWRASDGASLAEYSGHGDRVTALQFTPDGLRLISGSMDGSILVWGLP